MFSAHQLETLRCLLCRLQDEIRRAVLTARNADTAHALASVAQVTAADTIYAVDEVAEEAIDRWFAENWPAEYPVEVIAEGLDERPEPVTFPAGTPPAECVLSCIIDPIDGTRCLMFDKRSAWVLAALAPRGEGQPALRDICVAAMTELPTSKAAVSDQLSGVLGCGPNNLVCERLSLVDERRKRFRPTPSPATDFRHGFASFYHAFPEAKGILSAFEEDLWDHLFQLGSTQSPMVFEDQYPTTGGQLYELMIGHDRMIGDVRPQAYRTAGLPNALLCHPYDICTAMLAQELGCVIEAPNGKALDCPLDTHTPVGWIGFANPDIANAHRPLIHELLRKHFP